MGQEAASWQRRPCRHATASTPSRRRRAGARGFVRRRAGGRRLAGVPSPLQGQSVRRVPVGCGVWAGRGAAGGHPGRGDTAGAHKRLVWWAAMGAGGGVVLHS